MNYLALVLAIIHLLSLSFMIVSVAQFFAVRKSRCDKFLPLGDSCASIMASGTFLVWVYIVITIVVAVLTSAYFVSYPVVQ